MHALIVGNGTPPEFDLATEERGRADMFIAADGGGNWCIQNGLVPDLVIGDLDSFDAGLHPDIPCLKDPDQETNDMEKALNYVRSAGCSSVTILGATGSRLDHTLKNISVMARFAPLFSDLLVRDNMCWMRVLPPVYSFDVIPGTTVSLFPVSGVVEGICTTGLEYALNDESLENSVRDGSSNKALDGKVTIEHRNGILLLMVFDRLGKQSYGSAEFL
jgi:thiamine pyrophosphokinase